MTFLGPLFITLVAGGFFLMTAVTVAACVRSGQISREEQIPHPQRNPPRA
ncbi:hypothetical protein [Rhizobium ecuadorense]|nr:hypothetical protein [Rhizobium ecuadorense]